MSEPLKDTLNLPQTEFPMRASLAEREPQRIKEWENTTLYTKIQEKNRDNPEFILHDGPPFTNGDVHIGTALNKILKDTILRYKSMKGFKTPYVPGWDCHGLPIEHKVSQQIQKEKKDYTPLEIRKACAKFSADFIEKQRDQFKRLGVLADWEHEYRTMNPRYEAEILRTFAAFVEKGLVYRSKKPIYWSIPCKTALAEAEIEYKDHTSPSIFVKFKIKPNEKLKTPHPAYTVIWTTTPWTLPANLAIAVHPNLQYQQIHHNNETYLVSEGLADNFIASCKLEGAKKGETVLGSSLEAIETEHPFINRISPIVLGDHVTTEAGTGCVHTAPGHGLDDYFTGLRYKFEIYCPVDDAGLYIDDGQIPAELVGKSVLLKNGKSQANEGVMEIIRENGSLLHESKYDHSYPHCWRSKTPVIFRAMDQWFVNLDKNNTRKKAEKAIGEVNWIPGWGEKRIRGAVESRPDWCISRQRAWGVPIPAFYSGNGEPLLDAKVIRGIADKVEIEGTDIWFIKSAEELLEGIELPERYDSAKLKKGHDTLDVWIDSGSSHQSVLKVRENLNWPADLYFEGSDQHRGWFQSSLWTSIVLNESAPYKSVITHGFVVNEEKKKISKSDKKPQTADSYINRYGADIIRLWISSEDYRNDIPVSDGILKHIVQTYRTIRNTLRFQLGNLYDFDSNRDMKDISELTAIDKWALHKTAEMLEEVSKAYEKYEFHRVYQVINRFCSVTLSATYHDILKDRLYTYGPDWTERRASQTVIHKVLNVLLKVLAPIITFTAEEAFKYLQSHSGNSEKSIHLEDWPQADPTWKNEEVAKEVETIFNVRDKVNEKLEEARQKKELGQSLDAKVVLHFPENSEEYDILKNFEKELPEFFIVSQVEIRKNDTPELAAKIKHAEGIRCPRSWRWVPELVDAEGFGKVSARCQQALLDKYLNQKPPSYEPKKDPQEKSVKKS